MTFYTGFTIIYIGSTIVWLLSLLIAIETYLKAKEVPAICRDMDTIRDNLWLTIINTAAWATVILNVGYPIWPPFGFVLLTYLFLVELMSDP